MCARSPGPAHDAPEGRTLLRRRGKAPWPMPVSMDRAYEGDEPRQRARALGLIPVVPPSRTGARRGRPPAPCTSGAPRSNGRSAASRACGASAHDSQRSTSGLSDVATSRSSRMGCGSCEQALNKQDRPEKPDPAFSSRSKPPAKPCRCRETLQQRSHSSTVESVILSTQVIRRWTIAPQSEQALMTAMFVLCSWVNMRYHFCIRTSAPIADS